MTSSMSTTMISIILMLVSPWWPCYVGGVAGLAGVAVQQEYQSHVGNWREWNYYQILGLAPEDYYADIDVDNIASSPSSRSSKNKFPNRCSRTNQRSKITKKMSKKDIENKHNYGILIKYPL